MSAVAFLQGVKGRRLLDDFFEAPLRGSGPIAANEQGNLPNMGNIFKEIDEPDFADEAGYANEHDMTIGERLSNREPVDARHVAKRRDTPGRERYGASGGLHRRVETRWLFRPS